MIVVHPRGHELWIPGDPWRRVSVSTSATSPLQTWSPEADTCLVAGQRAPVLLGVPGGLLECDWETMTPRARWLAPDVRAWHTLLAHQDWVCGQDARGRLHLWHVPSSRHAWIGLEGAQTRALAIASGWLVAHLAADPGGVRAWRLGPHGRVSPHMRWLDRRGLDAPPPGLDTRAALAIQGDTALVFESRRPDALTLTRTGWQGVLAAYDLLTGRLMWWAHLDAEVTGDARGLEVLTAGAPLETGLEVQGHQVTCGTAHGCLLTLDARDGALLSYRATGSTRAVRALFRGPDDALWAMLEQGWLWCTSDAP